MVPSDPEDDRLLYLPVSAHVPLQYLPFTNNILHLLAKPGDTDHTGSNTSESD